MNKFHVETLRGLTVRFGESEARGEGKGEVGEEDELLEYFRSLYRNANKGIKGRGKGRKVASTSSTSSTPPSLSSSTSSLSSLASLPLSPPSSTGSYTGGIPAHFGMGLGGGGTNGGGGLTGMAGMGAMEMEMFDGSSSGIGSPCASSLGSLYEVGTFEEEEGGELAFGDRMY